MAWVNAIIQGVLIGGLYGLAATRPAGGHRPAIRLRVRKSANRRVPIPECAWTQLNPHPDDAPSVRSPGRPAADRRPGMPPLG